MALRRGHAGDPAPHAVHPFGLVQGTEPLLLVGPRPCRAGAVAAPGSPVSVVFQPRWAGGRGGSGAPLPGSRSNSGGGVLTELSREDCVQCSSHRNTKPMVPSRGHLTMSGDPAGLHIWEEALLASSGEAQAAPRSPLSRARGSCTAKRPSVPAQRWAALGWGPGSDLPGPSRSQHGVCEPL